MKGIEKMESRIYVIAHPFELRKLCIENNWFTCGTSCQYEKLFYANEHGFTLEQIALIIWLCSDGCFLVDIREVLYSYVPEERRLNHDC